MPYGLVNADVMQTSTPNGVLGAKNASTLQNRLINAGFAINQRGYTSGTALSAGTYAHDRWKAGASGCTYTFTQLSTGVPIVITITAGSLQQVIEGANIPDGGTFTLSWTGTAQARFNGGTYGSSPLAVTGLTAGSNCTIEFNTGTCSYPQLEVGSSATGYEYRQYQQELALCQRYYYQTQATATNWNYVSTGVVWTSSTVFTYLQYPVPMRSAPTVSTFGTINSTNVTVLTGSANTGATAVAGAGSAETNNSTTRIDFTTAAVLTVGQGALTRFAQNTGVTVSAEL
jgi:hypothetical protein